VTETLVRHWQRRNSIVDVRRQDSGELQIVKRYHTLYSAAQEYAAYERLDRALANVPGVRAVRRYPGKPDEIRMEYVEGPTLAAKLVEGPMPPVAPEQIGQLLAAVRELKSDADPSNLLLERGAIVVIDPLLKAQPLPHLSAVVFLHGVIKAAAASLPRVWRWPALVRFARAVAADYSQRTGASAAEVLSDLAVFQKQVMAWNRESDRREGLLRLVLRRYALVPLLGLIRQFILLRERRSRIF